MGLGNPDRPIGGLAVQRPAGVELRPLARDDFEVALRLAHELYDLPDTDAEPHRARYERLVADPDGAHFLAHADGEPAGMLLFRFRRRLNHATFEGWVSDLVVSERFRGRGIGRMLMAAAIAEWRLRGSHRLTLEVAEARTAARGLYAAMGMRDSGPYFEMTPVRPAGREAPHGVRIRPAVAGDFEAATRVLAELVRPVPTAERMPALERTWAAQLRRADHRLLVAEEGGSLVGAGALELREPFFTTRSVGWIPDLVVTEAARGRGIGSALLEALLGEAEGAGAYAVALESGEPRTDAHALYRAAGMTAVGRFYLLDREEPA